MDWLTGRNTDEKKSAVKNVLTVMAVDGDLDQNELVFLAKVAARVGLDEADLKALLENPGGVEFIVPDTKEERAAQLMDVVFMMMADGKIDRREMNVCMDIAMRLQFPPAVVPKIVEALVKAIREGKSRNQASININIQL